MLLSLIIILWIIFNVYQGFEEGLIAELVRVASYVLAFLLALVFDHRLSSFISSLVGLNHSVWLNGLSFLIIFILVRDLLRYFGGVLNFIDYLPVIHQFNSIGGAIVGGIVSYLITFIVLSILLILPVNWLQQQYHQSPISNKIVRQTPTMTHNLLEKWLR